jgi:cell division protein FtsB
MIVHEDDELLRKRAADIKRLEQENQVLRDRKNDLEKNVAINKEIIGAIIDSI